MSAAPLAVDLERALFDVAEGADRAVIEAVARYPAIDAPAVPPGLVAALRVQAGAGSSTALAVTLLRAAAVSGSYAPLDAGDAGLAPPEAVDVALVARIVREALLGEALYAACTGEPARWVRGAGTIDAERPRVSAAALAREGARRPLVALTARPAPETLYLLGRFALTECFAAIVTDGGGPAEASRRLADLGVEVASEALDVVDAPEALLARLAPA